ncbi:class I SAM-dependent methyltransferase [Kitasatospora sp. NPDC091335]|uniref:class I SAM-dependent methyltransferase n=1 Tax=Kitasatospora sp. NPDC091335 TaxID=3364085 RepID=UPI0037F65DBE
MSLHSPHSISRTEFHRRSPDTGRRRRFDRSVTPAPVPAPLPAPRKGPFPALEKGAAKRRSGPEGPGSGLPRKAPVTHRTGDEERAREAGTGLRFHRADIFDAELPHAHYDLVYDSGCLHHLAPHRRVSYLALLDRVLAPGGHFGVTAFAAGAMGSERSDEELYRLGTLEGGLAYSPDELRSLFREFTPLEIRPMAAQAAGSGLFGAPFLLAALFRRATHG